MTEDTRSSLNIDNNEWRFTKMKLSFQEVKEGQIKIAVCRKGCCDKDK